MSFTKLDSGIVLSTVWQEPDHVRLVWITLLALVGDSRGHVSGTVPGLANVARVPVELTREALTRLASPDPDSRTTEHDGRRIEATDGGWRILNYAKYRESRDPDDRREQTRVAVAKHRAKDVSHVSQCKPDVSRSKPKKAQAEAEAEAEAEAVLPSSSTARERLPEDYRPDYDALRRASHSPETLDREVLALTSGRHPTIDHLTPEDVGIGMRELALAGASQSKLSKFVQVARDNRLNPRPAAHRPTRGKPDPVSVAQQWVARGEAEDKQAAAEESAA